MALGYGEGTGGGLTNRSRAAGGGYGGVQGAAARSVGGGPLTNDSGLYDYQNQHRATISSLDSKLNTPPAPLAGGGGGVNGGLGFSKQTENDMINAATDEISEGQAEAQRAAGERAAALGFARSGGTQEAMQRIDSAAADDKAGAARDVRIASANLGFEREQSDLDRQERASIRADDEAKSKQAQMNELYKHHSPSSGGGSGATGGPGKGGANKANPQIIGGGAGNLVPRQGGGWAPPGAKGPGGGAPVNPRRGNSGNSTF